MWQGSKAKKEPERLVYGFSGSFITPVRIGDIHIAGHNPGTGIPVLTGFTFDIHGIKISEKIPDSHFIIGDSNTI